MSQEAMRGFFPKGALPAKQRVRKIRAAAAIVVSG
jgi:hypothetical protein